ncbi:putative PurR-regulated permease PerM [Sphingomonas endophytica]|uniref:Putative PurR-regulated permease PerM n=1 Tax=Sphingomonas endophytica TaxID=869719 RepID=A0A7X0JED8_9SPHN|nr:AI-2E family transporter [Sphingomonas endophytica]MBB6505994.1 putative PurR-regulated permease PerM [Sphingomonas endophytica]
MSDTPEVRIDAGGERVRVRAGASPTEVRDESTRHEIRRAAVWLGMAGAIALVVLLIQPLLIIFAALVFAALLDGGVRLLGRVLPIGRSWRLLIVCLLTIAFLLGTFYLAGVQITAQAQQLRSTVEVQVLRVSGWLSAQGLMPGVSDLGGVASQAMASLGRVTSWLGTAAGALTSGFMIVVLGLFIAIDPHGYERGMQWMVPERHRIEFAVTVKRMAQTLRRLLAGRLLGMAFEGVLTAIALWIVGVPMAMILGILTGLLAFIPNIGAFISGALMVAVGFSAGVHTGVLAIVVYIVVQTFDGYVVIPMVAKRTVDLPPALTLGAQILASALFGIMGLALADPMTAILKTAMERRSENVEDSQPHD